MTIRSLHLVKALPRPPTRSLPLYHLWITRNKQLALAIRVHREATGSRRRADSTRALERLICRFLLLSLRCPSCRMWERLVARYHGRQLHALSKPGSTRPSSASRRTRPAELTLGGNGTSCSNCGSLVTCSVALLPPARPLNSTSRVPRAAAPPLAGSDVGEGTTDGAVW